MRVLIVDDEPRLVESLREYIAAEAIESVAAGDGLAAKRLLGEEAFDAVVTDLRMPALDGLGLLRWIKDEGPPLPVIVISAHGDLRDAVEAMKLGAYDYLVKPFDPDELVIRLRKAVEGHRGSLRLAAGKLRFAEGGGLVGESPAMRDVLRLVDKVAPTHSTVLITGESGTGKEVVARAIHQHSTRSGGPFIAVNCGALPSELLESEIFGHIRGAFTGAVRDRIGRFELASKGTLFLDEIGDLPPLLQVKLLRVLQERQYERVGESVARTTDARIIAATNVDLRVALREGRLREDLYYRLCVVPIEVPPLRERREDIPQLALNLLSRITAQRGLMRRISPQAMRSLLDYSWPGNVRELANVVEYAVAVAKMETILPEDLPEEIQQSTRALHAALGAKAREPRSLPQASLAQPASSAEVERLLAALEIHRWRRADAARALGLSRSTLWRRMRELQLV